jgi:hypothetical protein
MSLVIDNPNIDAWIEESNTATERRLDARLGLDNIRKKFPFVIEWMDYSTLHRQASEAWSPRPEQPVAASYDGQTLSLHY